MTLLGSIAVSGSLSLASTVRICATYGGELLRTGALKVSSTATGARLALTVIETVATLLVAPRRPAPDR